MQNRLIKIKDAAKIAGLSPWQIRQAVANKQLCGVKLGKESKRCRYVTRESFEQMLKGGH